MNYLDALSIRRNLPNTPGHRHVFLKAICPSNFGKPKYVRTRFSRGSSRCENVSTPASLRQVRKAVTRCNRLRRKRKTGFHVRFRIVDSSQTGESSSSKLPAAHPPSTLDSRVSTVDSRVLNITSSLCALHWPLSGTFSALCLLLAPDPSICLFGSWTSVKSSALSTTVFVFRSSILVTAS
jgi:hypothetical protein